MSDDVDEAIRQLECKHRGEIFFTKIGASAEAAALIASSPNVTKEFVWDGVNLTMRGSYSEDQQAIDHFTKGPLAPLFARPADKANGGDLPKPDPALVEAARTSLTAKGQLLRALHGDEAAQEKVLADKASGGGDEHASNPFSRAGWSISKGFFLQQPLPPIK